MADLGTRSVQARFSSMENAARAQRAQFFEFHAPAPIKPLTSVTNVDAFRMRLGVFRNVAVAPQSALPILLDERLALYDQIVDSIVRVHSAEPFAPENQTISVGIPADRPPFREPAFLLGGWSVWYHWLINFLPRLYIIDQLKTVLPSTSSWPIAVPDQFLDMDNMLASLSALGYGKDRLVGLSDTQFTLFDKLAIPNIYYNSILCPTSIDFIRSNVIGSLGLFSSGRRPSRRLYISRDRGRPYSRRVLNTLDVDIVLRKFEFETIFAEELSFNDQVRAMFDASVVMGPHGSGLTNMIFTQESARLIELGGFPRSLFMDLAEMLGRRADTILVPGSSTRYGGTGGDAHCVDYVVEPDALEAHLIRLGL